MIKAWGDVPARFEPITSETIYVEKSDRMVVINQILADLLEAESYLGWPNENKYTQSTERVSKTFAKGLRARIALF
ncbi:UNVERIFIED_CONTAM: RagB/SusD family nutrient uptake outer membrane protein, partial [Prevotella sp. 15_C9]